MLPRQVEKSIVFGCLSAAAEGLLCTVRASAQPAEAIAQTDRQFGQGDGITALTVMRKAALA